MHFFFRNKKCDVTQFNKGDRVECIRTGKYVRKHERGNILAVFPESNIAAVKWDDKGIFKHSCGDRCEWGYGTFIRAEDIQKIKEE